ncbi:MAG TPA: radical SAM family heme chaperone HemW [Thermodesulfovibrionales bacterium]|nr:radical SAM family heme chaperone HemW [Thermodesulfovibrionales bacterium]
MINSLYIHIPFCIRKCIYCDFFSVPFDETLALDYMNAVLRELALRRDIAGELKTIYIGGGTPTVLPTQSLMRLLGTLKDSYTISRDAEITLEVNPGTIDGEKAQMLSGSGINRCSIGVQSFDDGELKLLGRIHNVADIVNAVEAVRNSGIGNLSLDLIYGIPGQIEDRWERNLAKAIELVPEHISAYELTPEKGTELFELFREKKLMKAPEETVIAMYYHTIDRLRDAGYRHYEISNFAKEGFSCRHNLNYWNRGEYIGIGAGAHSFIRDKRMKNLSDIGRYIEKLGDDDLAIEETVELSCEEAIKEFIFLGLRKAEGLDIREFRQDLGIDILEVSAGLIADGLLESDGDRLRLTRSGIVVSNTVIAKLFEELERR